MSRAAEHPLGQGAAALSAGALFGLGLALAGMTRPEKVLGFLDVTRAWDPSLLFVMGGAIAVHALAFRLITRRASPVFAARFLLPTRRDFDGRLLAGAALFGVGWGLAGYCPGPGLASLVTGSVTVFAFVAAMLVGLTVTAHLEEAHRDVSRRAPAPSTPAASAGAPSPALAEARER